MFFVSCCRALCFFFFVSVIFPSLFFIYFICGALESLCCPKLLKLLSSKSTSLMIIHNCRFFFKQFFNLTLNPDLKPQNICITWIPSQVQDSTYSSFTFIDLSLPSANQPVKNLILYSFKPAPLKDSLELIGSLSLKRTQGNLMAEVKTAGEWAGCIQHAFITKLSCWLEYCWRSKKGHFPFTYLMSLLHLGNSEDLLNGMVSHYTGEKTLHLMHASWKLIKRTRRHFAQINILHKAVWAAWRGVKSSKIQDTLWHFPVPVSFLSPIGNGHWRTQARHHLLHHGGCVHHQGRWSPEQT